MQKIKIGLIGCGNISEVYLKNMTQTFSNTEVVAVADWNLENAERRAAQFGIPHVAKTNEELLSMEDVQMVVILTIPSQHYPVCKAALEAGKHVYMEKPLALELEEGRELVALAQEKGVHLCVAPDTLLGANAQTVRKLLDDGFIGKPIAAHAHLLHPGSESWHPNPDFLYKKGAGPLYDVGPYFIACISYLLGSVTDVAAMGKISFAQRKITSQPHYGEMISVEVPTFWTCSLKTEQDVLVNLILTFDVKDTRLGTSMSVEIYGDKGTIGFKAPSSFDGPIYYKKRNQSDWTDIATLSSYREDCRGVGVADMANAILNGRAHRLSAEMALHNLEIMDAITRAGMSGKTEHLTTRFDRTPAMDLDLDFGEMD